MKKLIILLLLTLFMSGCNVLAFPFFVLFGQSEETVKAEYTGLNDKKIAVIAQAGPSIQFDYPYATVDLITLCNLALSQRVKDTEYISPEQIDQYQQEDLDWLNLPVAGIGQKFQVQRVIYIDLIDFTTTEINSVNLLRGYITADVRVYEMESENPNRAAYETEIAIVHPEQGPLPMGDAAQENLYQQTMIRFADELSKKFHTYKRPRK